MLPGGFGTMDELFEALTLVAIGKITKFPIVLVGSAYWNGLLGWLKVAMLAEGNSGPKELELFQWPATRLRSSRPPTPEFTPCGR